jgi:hypothetical protein
MQYSLKPVLLAVLTVRSCGAFDKAASRGSDRQPRDVAGPKSLFWR